MWLAKVSSWSIAFPSLIVPGGITAQSSGFRGESLSAAPLSPSLALVVHQSPPLTFRAWEFSSVFSYERFIVFHSTMKSIPHCEAMCRPTGDAGHGWALFTVVPLSQCRVFERPSFLHWVACVFVGRYFCESVSGLPLLFHFCVHQPLHEHHTL